MACAVNTVISDIFPSQNAPKACHSVAKRGKLAASIHDFLGRKRNGSFSHLQPVVALGLWTAVMMIWMYATRIPAIGNTTIPTTKWGIRPVCNCRRQRCAALPIITIICSSSRRFYAIAITIAVAGHVDAWAVNLAWAFVAIRVVHSLVQSTANVVLLRFGIFMVSWLVLIAMMVREALVIF